MAEPQGLNIPAIITSGVVGTLLTMTVVEGVRAYYNHYESQETANRWELDPNPTATALKVEQTRELAGSPVPIGEAMRQIVAAGGKIGQKPGQNPAKP
ncbi:MAG: hypothetical protein H7144_14265 [Burkholderiales bacterium]|nr:hypothetical protein [Phycisphaerae bacterium]